MKEFTVAVQQKNGSWKDDRWMTDRKSAMRLAFDLSNLRKCKVVVWRNRERSTGIRSAEASATYDRGVLIFDEEATRV